MKKERNMARADERLEELYRDRWEKTEAFRKKCEEVFAASGMEEWSPCQYSCCTPEYERSRVRVMVVGKESNGWDQRAGWSVRECMDKMRDFLGGRYASPFWRFAREFGALLNGRDKAATRDGDVFYANIFRISNDAHPAALYGFPDLVEEYLSSIQTLADEIAIAAPDVALFLTGPGYDGYLARIFPGLRFEQALPSLAGRAASRLVHPALPRDAFRLYHPGYAVRYKDTLWDGVMTGLRDLIPSKKGEKNG